MKDLAFKTLNCKLERSESRTESSDGKLNKQKIILNKAKNL